MPRFRIKYQTEDWWTLDVEAADMSEAMTRFHEGSYNHADAVLEDGGYICETVEIAPID